MYKQHSAFDCPDDDTIVWKYMDLFKYLDLISNRTLFMQRIDLFWDKSEGLDKNTPNDYAKFHSLPLSNFNEHYYNRAIEYNLDLRKRSFLSSWHINEYESSIMWDAYSNRNGGILIKSTVGKLKSSIKGTKDIHIAKVVYSKYPAPLGNYHQFLSYKHPIYNDERELRLLYIMKYGSTNSNFGEFPNVEDDKNVRVDVDVDELIDCVYFHPLTEDWIVNIMSGIITRISFNLVPEKSKIYS